MKIYSIVVLKCVDEEYESYILDGKSFTDKNMAIIRMNEFAKTILDDWNKSDNYFELNKPTNEFCSITSSDHPDYMSLIINGTELE